jgi:Na+/glutamate symporter
MPTVLNFIKIIIVVLVLLISGRWMVFRKAFKKKVYMPDRIICCRVLCCLNRSVLKIGATYSWHKFILSRKLSTLTLHMSEALITISYSATIREPV